MRAEDYIPALKQGAKIYPENLAGMIGLAKVTNVFYVDPNSGNDATNGGRRADDAFATAEQVISAMTAAQDDVAVFAGTNSTGRTNESNRIDFSKRRCHFIGNGALRKINPRNGVGAGSSLTGETTNALVTISANDQTFVNMSFATFQDNDIDVDITAPYNTFVNVHFQGIGVAAAGDAAGARALRITGADENEFYNCTVGIDTVTRSAANSLLEQTGTVARTKYVGTDFLSFGDAATPTWVKADTGNCYERYLKFIDCSFNNPDNASSTTMTIGFDLSTTGNGDISLSGAGYWRGATDLANNYDNLYSALPVFDGANAGVLTSIAT